MEKVNDKLLIWGSEVDHRTREQASRATKLPFVPGHVALMPDAHVGIGATVGSVIPTEGAIVPSFAGVDLGCGMIATETIYTADDLPNNLDRLLSLVSERIPAGVGKGRELGYRDGHRDVFGAVGEPFSALSGKQQETAIKQFGTLGSGNHFVEVSLDERGKVWTVLHSGSRGIGNQLATHHIGKAKGLMKEYFTILDDPNLAYFTEGTPEFHAYIQDMLWAQRYAYESRARMNSALLKSLAEAVHPKRPAKEKTITVQTVNCLAAETSVITSLGTRSIAELAGEVHVLLTTNGEWVKAPVRSFGRQRLMQITLSRSGVVKIVYATEQHRWFLRTHTATGNRLWGKRPAEAVTRELRPGDRLAWSFSKRPEGCALDPAGIARGFVFGDGSRSGSRSLANFCGDKDKALLPYFDRIGNPPRTYGAVTRITGLPGEWKTQFPSLDSSPDYLYGWLAGYFAADGDVDKTGRPTLASASRESLEHVRVICNLAGVGTYGIRERLRSGFGEHPTPLYLLGLMRGDLGLDFFMIPEHHRRFESGRNVIERRGWTVVSVETTDRVEEVYCAVVDGTHAFTLEDHILTSNCHHNYTERENHLGKDLWITRKGAISARAGEFGVIPGSMGTDTYIVRGKGNPESYCSSSHGAGRRLSRGDAKRQLDKATLRAQMKGKTWNEASASALIDEDPRAYKDIKQVMADQSDLTEVVHVLSQVLNYKGTG
jgi:RNA-splicing ligase RtcB